jgi:glycosyltransferase involved in cell wall biosynthesis
MIYVCIPSFDEGPTVGLVLWKIRKVFEEFPREYQLLVVDDGSSDGTPEILEPYAKVLPLTLVRHARRQGYARSVMELLQLALSRSDRPKRDCAILMHADFSHGPEYLPEFVRRLESGADLVVGQATLEGEPSRAWRIVRRWAPVLLRRAVRIPGVPDTASGFAAFRLMTLRGLLQKPGTVVLVGEGWAANAELIGRAARTARRVESIEVVERHDRRARPSRTRPWRALRELWRASREIQLGESSGAEAGAAS